MQRFARSLVSVGALVLIAAASLEARAQAKLSTQVLVGSEPGFLVTAKALLDANPNPTRDEIREALSGCLCRCTGYQQIFEAVEAAIAASAGAGPRAE